MMQFLIVLVLCNVGAIIHYLVSWANGKVTVDFTTYCTKNPKSTLVALLGIFMASIAFMATGSFNGSEQSIALAILAGYTSDSALNKA